MHSYYVPANECWDRIQLCATDPVLPVRYRDGYLRRACHTYRSNHPVIYVPGSGVVCMHTQRTTLEKAQSPCFPRAERALGQIHPSSLVSYQVQGPTKYIYITVTGRLGSSPPPPPGAFLRAECESCAALAFLCNQARMLTAVAFSASCSITERGDY